jgi:hypothetical protein
VNALRTPTTEGNDLAAAFRRAIEDGPRRNAISASIAVTGNAREMHPVVRDEVYRIGRNRHLRGHVDAHRCLRNSLNRNCVGGIWYASARAWRFNFQPCSFKAVVSLCRFRFRNGCWLMAIQEQRGFKSCPADRSAATVVVIELLLKGFAGAGFEPAIFGLCTHGSIPQSPVARVEMGHASW